VLQNLLSNAVKYARPKSKQKIEVKLAASGRDITITVRDQGMGIPQAEQKRVFQKFFRAKNVRKTDTDGNGLGLYISRSIMERLGGTITFTSQENKGTEFVVKLRKDNKSQRRGK
jgi:signal transduction histidine kinase